MKGYPITVNIFAENESEVNDAHAALVEFIDGYAEQGIPVTAPKIAKAIRSLKTNPFARYQVTEFLQS